MNLITVLWPVIFTLFFISLAQMTYRNSQTLFPTHKNPLIHNKIVAHNISLLKITNASD